MTYENGYVLALLIAAVKMVVFLAMITSVRAKNLAKVGLYYNPMTDKFEKDRRNTPGKVAGLTFWLLVFTPIFSWLTVASAALTFIAAKVRGQNAVPERVKELRFKLNAAELSKEAVEEIVMDLARVVGIHAARVDVRASAGEDPDTLFDNDDNTSWRFTLDRKRRRYTVSTRVDTSAGETICEYRVEGDKILSRVIEERHEDYDQDLTVILNGIVQEDEIRADFAKRKFSFNTLEETLESHALSVQWSEVTSSKVRFFILARSPDQFPEARLNELVFAEIDRLTKGAQEFRRRCLAMGLEACRTDGREEEFRYPKGFPEASRARVETFFENSASTVGVTSTEAANHNQIIKEIREAVGMSFATAC